MTRRTPTWLAMVAMVVACGGGAIGTVGTIGPDAADASTNDSSLEDASVVDASAPNVLAACVPLDCAKQGIECGAAGDGCGGLIGDCGKCLPGVRCGGPGAPSKCVSPNIGGCVPKTCAEKAIECGPARDDCGGIISECGPCDAGLQCGDADASAPSKCVTAMPDASCTPSTCAELGVACGPAPNGCGGLIADCGACTGNTFCKNGACVPACAPATCSERGAECGYVADGCGGVVDCGVCPDGFTCGANHAAYRCVGLPPF